MRTFAVVVAVMLPAAVPEVEVASASLDPVVVERTGCATRDCLRRTCAWSCRERVMLKRWRRLRDELPPPTRAMLARLRGCETRGIVARYGEGADYRWDGHHDGAYQYDRATWHEAGGSGFAWQASPAEQDVRTARFYPSHRHRWQCRA